MVTRTDFEGNSTTYLICNKAYGQSASVKYNELIEEFLKNNQELEDAFDDDSIGAISAISTLTTGIGKTPSKLIEDRFSIDKKIMVESRRLDNVFIDGIQIKETRQDIIKDKILNHLFNARPRRHMRITADTTTESVEQYGENDGTTAMSTISDISQHGTPMRSNTVTQDMVGDNQTQNDEDEDEREETGWRTVGKNGKASPHRKDKTKVEESKVINTNINIRSNNSVTINNK